MEKNKTDQISIEFSTTRDDSYSRLNSSMFLEDMAFSRYRIKKEYLSTILKCENPEEVIDFLSNRISIFRYRNRWGDRLNLEDSVLDLIEFISARIARNGYCVFEIIKGGDDLTKLKVVLGDIQVKKKEVVQLIPSDIAKELNCKTKISIPRTKCFLIEFPKVICSGKKYKKILKEMGEIDDNDPMYSILNPSNLTKIEGYDPMKHRKKLDLILRQLTRDTSWHHREHSSSRDIFSNYYVTLRSLRFKRTKIILLKHIFDFIESIVANIFEGPILKIEYAKTIEDIDKIIENYEIGKFTHEQHMKIITEYSL